MCCSLSSRSLVGAIRWIHSIRAARSVASTMVKHTPLSPASPAATPKRAAHIQIEGSTSLGKRVPVVRPNADIGVFQTQVIERNALVRVVDMLSNDKPLAVKVWEALENGVLTTASQADRERNEQTFFSARTLKVEKLDKEWLASWLTSASRNKLTSAVCDEIDGNDEYGLMKIFCCATALTPQTVLPSEALHKQTCWKLMSMRYLEKGDRLKNISSHIKGGKVSWTTWAAYILEFHPETKKLVKVKHIEGDEVKVDEHSHATMEFDLVDPWFDFSAKLERGGTIHTFAAMFGQGFGPHKAILDKKGRKIKDMVGMAAQEVQDALQRAQAGVVTTAGFLKSAGEKQSEERKLALAKARAKLANKNSVKRKVKLA